jgi:hypothetical protein
MSDADDQITYRDTDGLSATQEEWDALEKVLSTRGWMSLNRNTTPCISLATDAQGLAGFFVCQFVCHAGPLWVRPRLRGTDVPFKLASHMYDMISGSRGVVIVADSPWTMKMCEMAKMKRVESPVYVFPGAEV